MQSPKLFLKKVGDLGVQDFFKSNYKLERKLKEKNFSLKMPSFTNY